MKHPHYSDYPPENTQLCEAALLTVWDLLDDYRADLVLIGGLVPRYLCKVRPGDLVASTMDVDLALSLAARGTAHNRIAPRLQELGFTLRETAPGVTPLANFTRKFGSFDLVIEFLTDRPRRDSPALVELDNMYVPAIHGISRAIGNHRTIRLAGTDLNRVQRTQEIKVCEAGPFLCLKLQAYAADSAERAGKDAFDIVHTVLNYDRGPDAAISAFAAERGQNLASDAAMDALRRKFANEKSAGPNDYAEFCLGGTRGQASASEFEMHFAQRVQEAALVGTLLLRDVGSK